MEGFLNWFYAYVGAVWQGVRDIFQGLFSGIVAILNIPAHVSQFSRYSRSFGVLDWMLAIFAALLVVAMWAALFMCLLHALLRGIRFRREHLRRDELLQEVDELNRRLRHVTQEHADLVGRVTSVSATPPPPPTAVSPAAPASTVARFHRLHDIDRRYQNGMPPTDPCQLTLQEVCECFRNYAAAELQLYYSHDVICQFFAGLAASRLIILQGMSGTGKTSLPYALGKFLTRDAAIAAVQPAWTERTDLLGYLNEFTHTFHETDVLCHLYESTYRDDIGLIVLDEMNIARVEYYFADMLSLLELPDPAARRLTLLSEPADNDPAQLRDGKLTLPQNVWFVGTANYDESTHAIADKVYDRAITLNLDAKGTPFDATPTPTLPLSYRDLQAMLDDAVRTHPLCPQNADALELLDVYLTEHFRISFGNRARKHLNTFVPVYVACGGEESDAIDCMLVSKVLRKLEAQDLSASGDRLEALMRYLDTLFGVGRLHRSRRYLEQRKPRG